jgi:hypothetical protein
MGGVTDGAQFTTAETKHGVVMTGVFPQLGGWTKTIRVSGRPDGFEAAKGALRAYAKLEVHRLAEDGKWPLTA